MGNHATQEDTESFLKQKVVEDGIDPHKFCATFSDQWESIGPRAVRAFEEFFDIRLNTAIAVYLTLHSRRPYSLTEAYFYVTFPKESCIATCLHELMHFYTYYSPHTAPNLLREGVLYNDAKEALTVLLNSGFNALMNEEKDRGYRQHQSMREQIAQRFEAGASLQDIWSAIEPI